MSRSLKQFIIALSVVTLACLTASRAPAQTVPHRERCSGTITNNSPTAIEYACQGVATSFGKYTIVGGHEFDPNGNIFNGGFTSTAADGSTIWGIYIGTTTILPDGRGRSDLHVLWIGGTGRFEGASGEGEVVCFHGLSSGARLEYVTEGTLTLP